MSGLVIRNNVLERLAGNLRGEITHNPFTRAEDADDLPGENNRAVSDLDAVFLDHANNDFRLRPGSSAIGAGTPGEVTNDLRGNPRDPNRVDVGTFAAGD